MPHTWSDLDVVALSLLGKHDNSERMALAGKHTSLDAVLQATGAMDAGLRDEAQRILDTCRAEGVQVLTYWQAPYPARLRGIPRPPMLLFVKGALPGAEVPAIAVVGTRSCTVGYGQPVTELLVRRWTEAGCAIVSGLANGIDMLAHEACLRAQGRTVAVIASGIGRITPIMAQKMADRMASAGGAVVSEHPHHVAALPPYFPARNRIISGLSDAVVVVESKDKGGALITAEFAIEQHTPLWAVPGPITSTRSVGTNQLIASGIARMVTGADAVLAHMELLAHEPEPPPLLSTELDVLGGDSLRVDEVARRWGCTVQEAMVRLMELEMDGKVQQVPGARYVLARTLRSQPKFAHDRKS
jgi:DNA processing protein